ncbi:hypothetical protein B0H16DRAFT_1234568, partial [Mycena metata]
DCGGLAQVMTLRGIVYLGNSHFVCRFISKSNIVWYHDGIETGRTCMPEGRLRDVADLCATRGKNAVLLVY